MVGFGFDFAGAVVVVDAGADDFVDADDFVGVSADACSADAPIMMVDGNESSPIVMVGGNESFPIASDSALVAPPTLAEEGGDAGGDATETEETERCGSSVDTAMTAAAVSATTSIPTSPTKTRSARPELPRFFASSEGRLRMGPRPELMSFAV